MAYTRKTTKANKSETAAEKKKRGGSLKEKIPFNGEKFKKDIYDKGANLQSLCVFCKVSKTTFSVACTDNEIMPELLKKACALLELNVDDYNLPKPVAETDDIKDDENHPERMALDIGLFRRMDASAALIKEQNRLLQAQNEILKENLRVQQQYLKSLVDLAENIYDDTTKIRTYGNYTAAKVRQLVEELTGSGNSCAEKPADNAADSEGKDGSRDVKDNIEKAKDYIEVVLKQNNVLYESNAKKFMENEKISELEFAAATKELGVIKTFTGYGKNRKQMYVYNRDRVAK